MELNSREWALIIWLTALLGATLLSSKIRPSVCTVLKAALQRKLVWVVVAAALFTAGCSWLLAQISLWQQTNLKTTAFWFIGSGLPLIADAVRLHDKPARLAKVMRDAFALTAIIIFIGGMNLATLG